MNQQSQNQSGQMALTPEQARSRRARNIAISLTIGFLAVLFYGVTLVKLGMRVGSM
jgi:hypothetical protein